jgi:surface polysaccharide O-acyltransferase-like enzyme
MNINNSLTKRNSNLELLRIILMIMIFILHFIYGTDAINKIETSNFNYFLVNILEGLSIVAVNCFVLISGYFSIKFRFKKILKLIFQVKFYAIILPLIVVVLFKFNLSIKILFGCLFPIIFRQWWFVNTYIVLYFLSPMLNHAISKITKVQFKRILILLVAIFSLFNTMYPTFNTEGGHGIYNFILLYLIGSYIRRYSDIAHNKYKYLSIYFLNVIIVVIGNFVLTIITNQNSIKFYNYDNIFVIIASVSLFLFFCKLNIQSDLINKVAKLSFGTYLIHAHVSVWTYLKMNLFNNILLDNKFFVINAILSVVIGFILCLVVEKLRVLVTNKIENRIISSKLITRISEKIDKFMINNL